MTAALFLGFVAVMVTLVVELTARYLNHRVAFGVVAGLSLWFLYIGLLVYFGVPQNPTLRPPGPAFILLPATLLLAFFIVRLAGGIALAFPLWMILGAQTFRVVVELFLHQLWIEGLIPKMLTFAGANVDIYIGASAPLIAWVSTRGRSGLKLAFLWNLLGLCGLANVVVRALLTAPGPLNRIHTEVPNLMMGKFPFLLIPGFFVPLAIVLHVLAMRSIRIQLSQGISAPASKTPESVGH
jgi:hypothetical protein